MNAITKEQQNAITLPERASVALGAADHEVKLRELVKASAGILTIANKAGRDECHSAYMTLKNTRVSINHTVEEVTEDAKAFTKAVKAEALRLLAITQAEEDRLQVLRDAWDEKIEAEKAAKIAAERARVERIQSDIAAIRDTALSVAGKSSEIIAAAITVLGDIQPTEARFEEFAADALKAISDTMDKLAEMGVVALASEKAAADAEAARLAEIARMEAERAELAKLRAEQDERERIAKVESDRIAAEQSAEAKRLADIASAQQAEQARVAAESKCQMEAQQAEIAAAQRKLAEQQEAADKRDADAAAALKAAEAAALAKEQDAQRREDDHGPALEMNAAFDATEAEDEIRRCQMMADQHLADSAKSAADERKCGLPAGALRYLADQLDPSDGEVEELREAVRNLLAMQYTADAIRNVVESELLETVA